MNIYRCCLRIKKKYTVKKYSDPSFDKLDVTESDSQEPKPKPKPKKRST